MRDARRRLAKLEAQVNEVLGPPPPTPEEEASRAAEWTAIVERWAGKLLASMNLEPHGWVATHWVEHVFSRCHEKPCMVVPPGLLDHL
jgi:hypothetical protein